MAERQPVVTTASLPSEQMVAPGQGFLPPWPATLFLLSAVFPVFFYIGDFLLTPMRVMGVLAILIVPIRLFLAKAYGRITVVDFLIVFYAVWVMISYLHNHGTSQIVLGGLTVTNILGGYLVGRATIRTVAHMQAVARLLATILIALLPFAIYESITADYVIPDIIKSISGLSSYSEVDIGRRLGLDRAQVVFVHPIHWGLFCSLPISLYMIGLANQVSLGRRVFVAVFVIASGLTSLSSGPILATFVQVGLIAYALVFRALRLQWPLFTWGFGVFYLIGEFLSDRFFFYALASRVALNPGTAFYRTLIWDHGTAQVARTPLLGVASGYWERPFWMTSSIDNYWLQTAVSSGIPAAFAMVFAFLYTTVRIGKGTYVRGTDAYNMRVAVTILMIGLFAALATVTLWNEMLAVVMFLLGACAFMLQAQPVTETTEATSPPKSRRAHLSGDGTAEAPDRTRPTYTRFPAGVPTGDAGRSTRALQARPRDRTPVSGGRNWALRRDGP